VSKSWSRGKGLVLRPTPDTMAS